jgi:hypothetical protein
MIILNVFTTTFTMNSLLSSKWEGEAGGVVEAVKCLSSTSKALSSTPCSAKKNHKTRQNNKIKQKQQTVVRMWGK